MASSLLLHAVAGYLFLITCELTRHQAARASGYHVLLQSAAWGFALYLVAHAAAFGLDHWCESVVKFWSDWAPEPFTGEVMLSLVLALAVPYALRFCGVVSPLQIARGVALGEGGHIELLILDSMEHGKAVELTLRNRKSYVGLVTDLAVGENSSGDLVLIPMLSGYRNEETLKLEITTDYIPVVRAYTEPGSTLTEDDFRVAVPLNEIVSARPFEKDVYDAFQAVQRNNLVQVDGSPLKRSQTEDF